MNDPHVVALNYSIKHDSSVDYSKALPLDHEDETFRIKIEDKQVRLELKEHYPTEEAARQAVDRYISSWELNAALSGQPGQFKLTFQGADIVDWNPTPPTPSRRPGVVPIAVTATAGAPTVRLSLSTISPKPYPPPPSGLTLNPDDPNVSTLYNRFIGYLQNREPLTSMANFCLTVLETSLSKGRRAAAAEYGIDKEVLRKIGNLTANKGGREGARKASGIGNDLTRQESRFLVEAVKAIILRVAKVAHDPEQNTPKITLSDLPDLSS